MAIYRYTAGWYDGDGMTTGGKTILVGGGGFARELASWIDHAAAAGQMAPLDGYIDDRPDTMGGHDTPLLGSFVDYRVRAGDRFLLGVGDPVTKARLVSSLRERGGQFARLIHPSAIVGRNCRHGEGVIMAPFSMNTADTTVSDFVTILSFSGLGHDSSAGAFTTISSHVDVMGHATLGDRVFVGSGARIMPSVSVGDDARVGAGALVMRSVKPGVTVFAPPAKRLRLHRDR